MSDKPRATNYGQRLRVVRELHGLTQQELTQALGWKSLSTINEWERLDRLPRAARVAEAAQFLGVTTDYLLGLTEIPRSRRGSKARKPGS